MRTSPSINMLRRSALLANDLLHAEQCLCCGCWARPARLGLCLPCRSQLQLDRERCRTCSRTAPRAVARRGEVGGGRCGGCLRRPPPFESLSALWVYAPPLDRVIQAFKFSGHRSLGRELATEVHRLAGSRLSGAEALVPLPLHWRRRWRRGFNQAEVLADQLSKLTGRPVVRALRRPKGAPPQASLKRDQRQTSIQRAFDLARTKVRASGRSTSIAEWLRGRHVLLIDDVVTSGATIRAASRVLKRAGAGRVNVLVLARTLEPGLGPGQKSSAEVQYGPANAGPSLCRQNT